MKEHKNPKVLSEGVLWMVSVVDDFGVSHIKLKVFKVSLLHVNLVEIQAFLLIIRFFNFV